MKFELLNLEVNETTLLQTREKETLWADFQKISNRLKFHDILIHLPNIVKCLYNEHQLA
jgi:hypothetical protein